MLYIERDETALNHPLSFLSQIKDGLYLSPGVKMVKPILAPAVLRVYTIRNSLRDEYIFSS